MNNANSPRSPSWNGINTHLISGQSLMINQLINLENDMKTTRRKFSREFGLVTKRWGGI